MEGNLNRARHSLFLTTSSSMPSIAGPTVDQAHKSSPPALDGDRQAWTLAPSKHRQFNSHLASSFGGGHGHARVFSETSVPSSLHTLPRDTSYDMSGEETPGAVDSGSTGHNFLDQQDKREPNTSTSNRNQGLLPSRSYPNRQHPALQPLNEDGPAPSSFRYTNETHGGAGGKLLNEASSYPDQAASDFDSKFPAQAGLTRSRSTVQMRELRDQMQDLRGKISNLKLQAREDNLRRRSLQSLRTPSPFTAAEQWYAGTGSSNTANFIVETGYGWNGLRKPSDVTNEDQEDRTELQSGLANNVPQEHFDNTSQPEPEDGVQSKPDQDEALDQDKSNMIHTIFDNRRGEDGAHLVKNETDSSEDIIQDGTNELEEYPEPSSEPVGERHEDRADAFDYQNFFLHSGMGTYRKMNAERRGSSSSTDSSATTRPNEPVLESFDVIGEDKQAYQEMKNGNAVPPTWHKAHSRQNSVESVSTVNSFATATEGRHSDGEPDEDDWIGHRSMAGAWQSERYVDKSKSSSRARTRVDSPRITPNPSLQSTQLKANGYATGVVSKSSSKSTERSIPRSNGIKDGLPSPSLQAPTLLVSAFTAPAPLPLEDGSLAPVLQYSRTDKELVEPLMESFRKVCAHLYTAEGSEGGKYAARVWRRRLEFARRVLDGETDGDAF